jgi:hypothetical protein
LAALGIEHVCALATGHDEAAFLLESWEMSMGVDRMIAVLAPEVPAIVILPGTQALISTSTSQTDAPPRIRRIFGPTGIWGAIAREPSRRAPEFGARPK